ncbi:helix-turn-helix domain-containing protein [Enterococcus durans]|nr:helix-turn-helix transcriptional regulator [Enterococcus durans]
MERQVFGKEIKRRRKEKNFSQYDLAVGICSQSMLSFIESGKYVPNAQIIVKLCERLDLNTDRLILHDHYAISPIEKFSEKCEELCNNHDYIALNKFLNQETVLQSIDTVQ